MRRCRTALAALLPRCCVSPTLAGSLTTTACRSVSVFAPTDVPKALATSFEPAVRRRRGRAGAVECMRAAGREPGRRARPRSMRRYAPVPHPNRNAARTPTTTCASEAYRIGPGQRVSAALPTHQPRPLGARDVHPCDPPLLRRPRAAAPR
jgi:hypothetical protein